MTFKEKWLQDHPGEEFSLTGHGTTSWRCPYKCGYEKLDADDSHCEIGCTACWNREMPGTEDELRILDSGERQQFETGAVRDIQKGKGRCDLMPLEVICKYFKKPIFGLLGMFLKDGNTAHLYECIRLFSSYYGDKTTPATDCTMFLEVAKHFEEGAEKYGENNWQKGLPVVCYINSAIRHYLKCLRGDKDEPHDRAFVWNLMCCIWECDYSPRATSKNEQDTPVMIMNHATGPHPVQVAYLCDKRACAECNNPDCHHTQDISHAVNFESVQIYDASGGIKYIEKSNPQALFENAAPGLYELFDCPCVKGADAVVYSMATGRPLDTTGLEYFRSLTIYNVYHGVENRVLVTAPAGALFYHESDVWLRTDVDVDVYSVYAVRLRDGKPEHISGNTLVTSVEDIDFH